MGISDIGSCLANGEGATHAGGGAWWLEVPASLEEPPKLQAVGGAGAASLEERASLSLEERVGSAGQGAAQGAGFSA